MREFEYTDFDAARRAFQIALRETAADLGDPEMDTDEFAADLCEAVALSCSPEVAFELCRTELGFIPSGLMRLRPDIRAHERRHPIEF